MVRYMLRAPGRDRSPVGLLTWSLALSGNRDLPNLAVVPVEQLILHEYHDEQRTPPIIASLTGMGYLRNPPVVVPFSDGSDRYMVLDGANRTTALRQMGIPHIVVQIVTVDDPGLDLNPWNHIVWGLSTEQLFDDIRALPGLNLYPSKVEHIFADLLNLHTLALLRSPEGRIYRVHTPAFDLLQRVDAFNLLVDSYKDRAQIDRTLLFDLEQLLQIYPQMSGLLLFPPYRLEDVIYMAGRNHLMPTGTTRFTVSPRALQLNYPLPALQADQSLAAKNEALQRWIQARVAEKRVRYYAEATFVFDE